MVLDGIREGDVEKVPTALHRSLGSLNGLERRADKPEASMRQNHAKIIGVTLVLAMLLPGIGWSMNDALPSGDPIPATQSAEPSMEVDAEELDASQEAEPEALLRGVSTLPSNEKVTDITALPIGESPPFVPDRRLREIPVRPPAPIAISPDALLPPRVHVEIECAKARVLELLSDDDASRRAYERCIGLGFESVDSWWGLGRTRLRGGDFEGAEFALLVAHDRLGERERATVSDDPEERRLQEGGILAELGKLYLLTRRSVQALAALRMAADILPENPRLPGLLERADLLHSGQVSLAINEVRPLWPEDPAQQRRDAVYAGLRRIHHSLPPLVQRQLGRVEGLALDPTLRDLSIAFTLGLVLVLLVMHRFKGRGDLVVTIEFPPELRGCFSVRVSARPGRRKRMNPRERAGEGRRSHLSSRQVHQMVSRETQFLRLPPKIYFVVVDGSLQDPENDEILMTTYDEQSIEVVRGETVRVRFDLQPRECPVDVRVLWDKQPTDDASVAARGLPQSLRMTRDGMTRLRLCKGTHTIVVGSGDRVAEREVQVQTFQPTAVEIDLAGTEGVIFKGCPPAVKPYLHGDLNAAARALSRDGHVQIANLLLARLHRDHGQTERAADYFHAAGHPLEAADLRASLSDFTGAAVLFQEAGDAVRSAQMFRAAGEWIRAGEAYDSIRDYESATECYRESGNTSLWLDALEKKGDFFEAAQISLEQSDRARAIRLLQRVGVDDRLYGEACELLAEAFEHEGHADLAVQKLEQRISANGGSPDLYFRLANLLENAEELDRALESFQQLRDSDPTYPEVAARIESLRKKITARKLADSRDGGGPRTSTPTAFLSERRYELIQELGRGGMGVVFRARDLRLDREVALKRLPDNLRDHPKAIQLFLREAQACARLNHRNIVTIYDTDQEDDYFFITMELLTGYPLNVIRRKKGRLAERDVAKLGIQVAEGLGYAHSHQIVHRDIKTANIFFTTDKVVKIMDFGLAKMMEEVRRGTTVLGGTPYYMAPEQSSGEAVDDRADIYAFGVTLFELSTGRVPFDDGDVAYHHRHTAPPDPRQIAPDLSDAMAELILHMLEKNPQRRCASAAIVERKLREIVGEAS